LVPKQESCLVCELLRKTAGPQRASISRATLCHVSLKKEKSLPGAHMPVSSSSESQNSTGTHQGKHTGTQGQPIEVPGNVAQSGLRVVELTTIRTAPPPGQRPLPMRTSG
jgi:hypothetical protein